MVNGQHSSVGQRANALAVSLDVYLQVKCRGAAMGILCCQHFHLHWQVSVSTMSKRTSITSTPAAEVMATPCSSCCITLVHMTSGFPKCDPELLAKILPNYRDAVFLVKSCAGIAARVASCYFSWQFFSWRVANEWLFEADIHIGSLMHEQMSEHLTKFKFPNGI